MASFVPTPARRGLDKLLELHPHLELVKASATVPVGENDAWTPWLLVTLGQPSERREPGTPEAWAIWQFAIWKTTGAVHTIGHDGAVSDDPILEP